MYIKKIQPHLFRAISVAISLLMILSCATRFSPQTVRREIVRQTGQEPEGLFELTLGTPTMSLIKTALGPNEHGKLPLAGLKALELVVYDTPEMSDLDFTKMAVRGWEPVIRTMKKDRSALVLIKPTETAISDLVVLAGGDNSVIYVRLKGTLSKNLPEAIGQSFESEGAEALKESFLSIASPGGLDL